MVVVRAPGGTPCASSVAQVEQSKRPALNSCPPNKKVFHQIRAMKTMQLLPPRSLLTLMHLLLYSGTSAASTRPHLRFSPPEATSFPTVAAWAQVLDNESPVTMLLARAPDVEVWALTVEARGHVMCWIFATLRPWASNLYLLGYVRDRTGSSLVNLRLLVHSWALTPAMLESCESSVALLVAGVMA